MIAAEKPTTKCPLCDGTVYVTDAKCRYCGTLLLETESGQAETPEEAKASDRFGPGLLGVPVAGSVVLLGWVGRLNVLQNPIPPLVTIAVITVIVSAVIVGLEAAAIGTGRGKKDEDGGLNLTPVQWILFTLLAWPVGFPLYCRARSRHGLKNLLEPGAILTVLFVAVVLGLFYKMHCEVVQHEIATRKIQYEMELRQKQK